MIVTAKPRLVFSENGVGGVVDRGLDRNEHKLSSIVVAGRGGGSLALRSLTHRPLETRETRVFFGFLAFRLAGRGI